MELKKSAEQLLLDTEAALELAINLAKAEGRSLVINKTAGKIGIADSLQSVELSPEVAIYIVEYISAIDPNFKLDNCSLGGLIDSSKSLKKTIENVRKCEYAAKIKFHIEMADYLYEVGFCLQRTSIALNKGAKLPNNQEYCILCWRLVDKHKLANFSDPTGYTNSYCAMHHPKMGENLYKKDSRLLKAAVKFRNSETDQELLRALNDRKTSAKTARNINYRLTHSFAPNPKKKDLHELALPVKSWKDRARQLKLIIEKYYPTTNEIISNIKIEELSSWQDWFFSVLKALDANNSGTETWMETGDFERYGDAIVPIYDNLFVGWPVMKTICRRHEAYKFINSTPQSMGPTIGSVPKNTELRELIKKEYYQQIENGAPADWKKIAQNVDRSPSRVYVLAKELGLL